MTINKTLKKILLLPIWLLRIRKIFSIGRKYRKTPDMFTAQERSRLLTKYAEKYLKMNNIELKVVGAEDLTTSGGVLLVANHKSNVDSIALLAALKDKTYEPNAPVKVPTFVAKKELLKKRLIKNMLQLLDSFVIDRKNFRESVEIMNNFGSFVKENKSYGIVFPEGTRVKEEELGEFKSGAFKIAQKWYLPIVPVTISNSAKALTKDQKGKITVTVTFHKMLKPVLFIAQDPKATALRIKNIIASKL